MGDPHKNVWGGKNNTWGHKNSNKTKNNQSYQPNKLFNTLACGVMIFIAGAFGLSLVSSAVTEIKGMFDVVDKATEIIDTKPNTSNTLNTSSKSKVSLSDKLLTDVIHEADIELESEDLEELLNKISDTIKANNLKTENRIFIEVNYRDCDTKDKYTTNIINRLKDFNETITFALISDEGLSELDINKEIENIQTISSDAIEYLADSTYVRSMTGGTIGVPKSGGFVFTVTYTTE